MKSKKSIRMVETHLLNGKWEKNPNEDVKRMLVSCITRAARKERVPFYPTELAFKRCKTGVFFYRNIERFLQEKYEEGWKQDRIPRQETGKRRSYQRI